MKNRRFATVLAAGILPLGSTIYAQVSPAKGEPIVSFDQSVARATVIPPRPPAGFHAETARDDEIAQYGLPPRPAIGSPQYEDWRKIVSPSITRIDPVLQQTMVTHGAVLNLSAGPSVPTNTLTLEAASSTNWSGYAMSAPAGTFNVNNNLIHARWVVPIAQQAFGSCDGTWWDSSQWVGFDGFGSNDVLQAGTEADAFCSGGTTTPEYSFWIEWAPLAEVRVTNLPVTAGDVVAVEVWYTSSAPFGHALLVNSTTNLSASVAFNPPNGTNFEGNSAEWIMERPTLAGGALADLTNYVGAGYFDNYVLRANGQTCYPGACFNGVNATSFALTMVCPSWTPAAKCAALTDLSIPELYGEETLWFSNGGPSN
jgi:hypothetical protein